MMSSIIFSFLDIPKLDLNKNLLIDFFDHNAVPFLSEKVRLTTNDVNNGLWNGVTIYACKEIEKFIEKTAGNGFDYFNNLQHEFNELFPEFKDYMSELPYDHFYRLQIWEQRKEIPLHWDGTRNTTKFQLRTMLINDNSEPTFHLSFKENLFYPQWNKSDSNIFLYDNQKCTHGSHLGSNRKLLLIIGGTLNNSKITELLDKSIKKYRNLALIGE